MQKKVICLALALLMTAGICGCKKEVKDETDDTVSYVTTYEDYYEDVEDDTDADASASSGATTKTTKKKASTKFADNDGNGKVGELGNKNDKKVNVTDFGGEKFTKTIIGSITQSVMRRKAQFEKKYNCKIELKSLQWEQYNSQVATAMAAGTPYDICGLQSQFWPEAGVQGLYEPLNSYILDSDLYDSKTRKGIDLDVSKEFAMNGNIYGVSCHEGAYASMLQVMYYNKLMFEDAGLKDPLKLYEAGEWTWDKFFEYAGKVKNASKGKYIMGQEIAANSWALSNGFEYTTNVNGKIRANVSDKKYLTALAKFQELKTNFVGPKGYSDDPTEFYNGNYYMFSQVYSYGYMYMYDSIIASSAFDNDFENLGVVPFPYGPDNTKKVNPGHGGQAKAAGKGSKNPRIVVLWTKFEREWNDPMKDEDPHHYSDEINKVISGLFDNVNDYLPNYKTSSQSARGLYGKIEAAAGTPGGDYNKAINDYKGNIQSVIDDSFKG